MNFKVGDIVFSKENVEKAFTVVDVNPQHLQICLQCTHNRIAPPRYFHTDKDVLEKIHYPVDPVWYGENTLTIIYKPNRKADVL